MPAKLSIFLRYRAGYKISPLAGPHNQGKKAAKNEH
jgi:hypothetical protein